MSQENPRTSAPLAPLQLVFVQLPEKKKTNNFKSILITIFSKRTDFRFILSNALRCLNILPILSLPAISLQLLRKDFI